MKRISVFILLILLVACSEPEITIQSPTEGQTYGTEFYIYIDATITDPDGVKRVSYKIYGNNVDFSPAGLPTTYELHDNQSMQALSPGYPVEIIIEAEDNAGHIGTKKVTVNHN